MAIEQLFSGTSLASLTDEERLAIAVQRKLKRIDEKTESLLSVGFPYSGKRFSISAAAKNNLDSVAIARDILTYPIPWSAVDNSSISLNSSTEVMAFYGAMMAFGTAIKQGAVLLRAQVAAIQADTELTLSEKLAALVAIEDPRF